MTKKQPTKNPYTSFTRLSFSTFSEELALIDVELAGLEIPKFHGQNVWLCTGFLRKNKSLFVTTLVTNRSSRWSFQYCEVVQFNGGGNTNLIREERQEKRR